MDNIKEIIGNVTKIIVPFEDDYTSVFVIKTEGGNILFDCATTKYDVDEYIVPALEKLGVTPDFIICSHYHGDHMGGEVFLAEKYPNAKRGKIARNDEDMTGKIPLSDKDVIFDCIEIVSLPGHCEDALALFDKRTSTLVSGDCLQLCGVGRYGTGVFDATSYIKSIEKLRGSSVENIITSHEYVPFGFLAIGKEAVAKYLDECEKYIYVLKDFANKHKDLPYKEIASLYNSENKNLPPVGAYTFKTVAEDIK